MSKRKDDFYNVVEDMGDFVLRNTEEGSAGYDLIRAGCLTYFLVVVFLIGLGWTAVASYDAPLVPSFIVGILMAGGFAFIFWGR